MNINVQWVLDDSLLFSLIRDLTLPSKFFTNPSISAQSILSKERIYFFTNFSTLVSSKLTPVLHPLLASTNMTKLPIPPFPINLFEDVLTQRKLQNSVKIATISIVMFFFTFVNIYYIFIGVIPYIACQFPLGINPETELPRESLLLHDIYSKTIPGVGRINYLRLPTAEVNPQTGHSFKRLRDWDPT